MPAREHTAGLEATVLEPTRAQRRATSRTLRTKGAGPEAATQLLCELAEDTRELIAGTKKALESGDAVRAQLAEGQGKLQEAIDRGNENTRQLADVIGTLTEELRRLREGG